MPREHSSGLMSRVAFGLYPSSILDDWTGINAPTAVLSARDATRGTAGHLGDAGRMSIEACVALVRRADANVRDAFQ